MAAPERPERKISHSTTKAELTATLAEIENQLELADSNENTLQRFFKRDELLELRDELRAELEAEIDGNEAPKEFS